MLCRGLALATLAIVGCHDAPARPAPRPTAPARASRALLEQALTTAVADATKARTLVPPPPLPAPPDDPSHFADLLTADPDVMQGVLGGLAGSADDPNGVVGGQLGGITGLGPLGRPPPPLATAVTVQLVADSDGLDGAILARLTDLLRASALACLRRATVDSPVTDTVTATVTLAATPGTGAITVHVSGAGPLAACLQGAPHAADLPAGATVTFQLTIPAP